MSYPANYCHLTISTEALEERVLKETTSLQDCCPQITIIAPGDGQVSHAGRVRLVTYRQRSRLIMIINAYLLALRLRARVYHLHGPELLILGWCFRLLTSAAIIYDAHYPTYHYFLWKFGPPTLLARFKATVLKLIEVIGVIFIDGLVMAAPRSRPGVGRFCRRKICVCNYPRPKAEPEPVEAETPLTLVYSGLTEKVRDLELILDAVFLVKLEYPEIELVITRPLAHRVAAGFDQLLAEFHLNDAVHLQPEFYRQLPRNRRLLGLATPNEDDFFQRSQQIEVFSYLAHSIPVICGRTPFTEDAVAEWETGVVLKNYIPLTVSETILELEADEQRRKQMGARGAEAVRRQFSWGTMAHRLCNFYRTLML